MIDDKHDSENPQRNPRLNLTGQGYLPSNFKNAHQGRDVIPRRHCNSANCQDCLYLA
jgi:hypothetical protein